MKTSLLTKNLTNLAILVSATALLAGCNPMMEREVQEGIRKTNCETLDNDAEKQGCSFAVDSVYNAARSSVLENRAFNRAQLFQVGIAGCFEQYKSNPTALRGCYIGVPEAITYSESIQGLFDSHMAEINHEDQSLVNVQFAVNQCMSNDPDNLESCVGRSNLSDQDISALVSQIRDSQNIMIQNGQRARELIAQINSESEGYFRQTQEINHQISQVRTEVAPIERAIDQRAQAEDNTAAANQEKAELLSLEQQIPSMIQANYNDAHNINEQAIVLEQQLPALRVTLAAVLIQRNEALRVRNIAYSNYEVREEERRRREEEERRRREAEQRRIREAREAEERRAREEQEAADRRRRAAEEEEESRSRRSRSSWGSSDDDEHESSSWGSSGSSSRSYGGGSSSWGSGSSSRRSSGGFGSDDDEHESSWGSSSRSSGSSFGSSSSSRRSSGGFGDDDEE